jgi:pimeloyl-ACP methyl ester carboxylesterase
VLLHCYTCSINWWQKLIPLLERGGRRVIAIDLLGHGGSEKPSSGYGMEDQAQLVAQALAQLGVTQATVVGHSLGGTVATALAQSSPDLVGRLVLIDQAPDSSFGSLDFVAKLGYVPVIGEASWRIKPHFLVKDGLGQAFAPGYDIPDQFVDDVYRMTYTSYEASSDNEVSYTDDEPLNRRIEQSGKPLLVIFGSEDQIYDNPREALSAYAGIPGAETALIQGAGHSPNVEKPAKTASLIRGFSRPLPPPLPPKPKVKEQRQKKRGAGAAPKDSSSAAPKPRAATGK